MLNTLNTLFGLKTTGKDILEKLSLLSLVKSSLMTIFGLSQNGPILWFATNFMLGYNWNKRKQKLEKCLSISEWRNSKLHILHVIYPVMKRCVGQNLMGIMNSKLHVDSAFFVLTLYCVGFIYLLFGFKHFVQVLGLLV